MIIVAGAVPEAGIVDVNPGIPADSRRVVVKTAWPITTVAGAVPEARIVDVNAGTPTDSI